jgi:DNA-directed RNA polymerase specialized sigma24 family protein
MREGSLAGVIDDTDAFTALVAEHHADVLRLAGAITGDRIHPGSE